MRHVLQQLEAWMLQVFQVHLTDTVCHCLLESVRRQCLVHPRINILIFDCCSCNRQVPCTRPGHPGKHLNRLIHECCQLQDRNFDRNIATVISLRASVKLRTSADCLLCLPPWFYRRNQATASERDSDPKRDERNSIRAIIGH